MCPHVFPLQNLVNAVVIGFAIGINATIAYFLGAQKQNTADKAASLGTLFNMIHGLILAVVCIAATAPFFAMFTDKKSNHRHGCSIRADRISFCSTQCGRSLF